MHAHRANLGSLAADDDVTAVAANPGAIAVAREDEAALDVADELAIALLMMLLDGTDHAELRGDLLEALLVGDLSELVVHVGPLVVLAIGGIVQIRDRVRNSTIMQVLEPNLGMLFLVLRSLEEDVRNLNVTLVLRLACVILVLGMGLRLAGKSSLQVLPCFAALKLHSCSSRRVVS